jgi:hypothetical protein
LIDSFTPESDVDIALDYLSSIPVFGMDTEFTREKGAVYIQISTLNYGFIFNLNEDEEEVIHYRENEGLYEDHHEQILFRYNSNF